MLYYIQMSNRYRLIKPYLSYYDYLEQNSLSGGKKCFYELMNIYNFQEGYFTIKNESNNTTHNFYGISRKKLYEQHGGNSPELSMYRQSNDFHIKLSEISKNLTTSLDSLNKLVEQELRRSSTEPLIMELKNEIQTLSKQFEKEKNESSCSIM